MERVINFLTSMKLALVLILVVTVMFIFATLIPQERELEFYLQTFGEPLGTMITTFHFDNFYRSIVFLVAVGLFFINLLGCSIKRFATRYMTKAPIRLGPDIIHLGILAALVGGLISLFTLQEGFIMAVEGETFALEQGIEVKVTSFTYQAYEDGRPKDWISDVSVFKDGELIKEAAIEVNSPLEIEGYRIFQSSYSLTATASLGHKNGDRVTLRSGEGLRLEDGTAFALSGIATIEGETPEDKDEYAAIIHVMKGDSSEKVTLKARDSWGDFTLRRLSVYTQTGLQVSRDPGGPVMMIALIIFIIGLAVTAYQKLGDIKE